MGEQITRKQLAINLIKEEVSRHGIIAREKAMKLYMKATSQNEMNGSINSAVTTALRVLTRQGYLETIERGLYKKA